MGRLPKSAVLKSGHDFSKQDLNHLKTIENEMKGDDDLIDEIPSTLDDLGKMYYIYLIENLRSSNILLSNLDKPILEQCCDCLSKIDQCREAIKEQGLTTTKFDKYGNETLVANPHIKIQEQYQTKFLQISSRLGLDPSSRSALAMTHFENKEKENDPVLNMLTQLKK